MATAPSFSLFLSVVSFWQLSKSARPKQSVERGSGRRRRDWDLSSAHTHTVCWLVCVCCLLLLHFTASSTSWLQFKNSQLASHHHHHEQQHTIRCVLFITNFTQTLLCKQASNSSIHHSLSACSNTQRASTVCSPGCSLLSFCSLLMRVHLLARSLVRPLDDATQGARFLWSPDAQIRRSQLI